MCPCRWETKGFESGEECVRKMTGKVDDPEAFCYGSDAIDSKQRKISFDTATLDQKILVDDDKYLVMPAVIASEIVHQYEDGWAYKAAEDLQRMAETAAEIGSVPVKILEHPGPETNYLLVKRSDVYGRAENFQFVKNLLDAKTKRPCRKGVRADIRWFKDRTPADVIEQIKTNTLHDVSIGFTFDRDDVAGEFEGVKYDYVQRNLFLNHIAAPIQAGRCPGPICGIGFDSQRMIEFDISKEGECPVCRRIREVGFLVAGKRLWSQYGADVLEVIEGHALPKVESLKNSIDEEFDKKFDKAFKELDLNLKS